MTDDSYMKRLKVFKNFTLELASLSKCTEKQVAAIIVDKNLTQVLSIGINGGPAGLVDCMCKLGDKYSCVHAEMNALVKCKSDAKDKVMIVTLSPCKMCAAAIINAPGSFSRVYYVYPWKDNTGIQLLNKAGIPTIQL